MSVAEAIAATTPAGGDIDLTDRAVRESAPGNGLGPVRVVIVDDSDTIRRMLRTAADMVGGIEIVGEAMNGQHGVEVCAALQPHAVILDVEMPVMDGVSAIGPIRAATAATKVMMFSSDTSRRRDALSQGASGYFEKGITSPLVVLGEIVALWD